MLVAVYMIDGQQGRFRPAPATRAEGEAEAAWIERMAMEFLPTGVAFSVADTDILDAPPPTKAGLKAHAEKARAAFEEGGLEVNVAEDGAPPVMLWVSTDARGRGYLNGLVTETLLDPLTQSLWSQQSGSVLVDAAQIHKMGLAASAHVKKGFAHRAAIWQGIDSEAITSFAEIDAWDWSAAPAGL